MKKKIVALLFVVVMLFVVCGCAFADTKMYSFFQEYGIEVPDFLAFTKGIVSNEDNVIPMGSEDEDDGNEIFFGYIYPEADKGELSAYVKFLEKSGFVAKIYTIDGEKYTDLEKAVGGGTVIVYPSWVPDDGVNLSGARIDIVAKIPSGFALASGYDETESGSTTQPAVLHAAQGSWFDVFGKRPFLSTTGLAFYEGGFGPKIRGFQLGMKVSLAEIDYIAQNLRGKVVKDGEEKLGGEVIFKDGEGFHVIADGIEVNFLGNDEVGYRILSFRLEQLAFGTKNIPFKDFAQEILSHYDLGRMNTSTSGFYTTYENDDLKNGWFVWVTDRVGGDIFVNNYYMKSLEEAKEMERQRAIKEAAIEFQNEIERRKKQMTFD